MRRQHLASVALTLLFASAAAAQAPRAVAPLTTVSIGPYFGLNYTTFYGDDDLEGTKSRTDIAVGGQVDFTLASTGFFRTGLIYSRRGAKGEEDGTQIALKLKYLEVPVLFGYRFPTSSGVKPYVMGGGHLAFKVGCSLEGSQGGISASIDCDNPDFGADFKSFDVALVGGAGLAVPLGTNSLSFDLRYAQGLMKIESESSTKNRGFTLGVALMIPIGK